MILKQDNLKELCKLAITASKSAGNIIAQHTNKQISIKNKAAGTSKASQVVTEVDLLCQKTILSILDPSIEEYELGLLTEESPDDNSRFEKDYFWCIDPMDGTLPFIEGTPGYSVSIALVSKSGIPKIGVIYDPVKNILYSAIKELGVFRNNKLWQLPNKNDSQTFSIFCDRSFIKHSKYDEILNKLQNFANNNVYKNLSIVSTGGAVMNACWVLENNPACYFKLPKKSQGGGSIWDFAASACIYNEIGAYTSNFFGKALELNKSDSTFMNKQGVLFASNALIADKILEIYHTHN